MGSSLALICLVTGLLSLVPKQRSNTHQMSIKEHISISVFLGRSQNLTILDFGGFKFYLDSSFLRIS